MDEITLKQRFRSMYEFSEEFSISTQVDLNNVITILKEVKKQRNQLAKYWQETKKPAKLAYDNIVAKEKEMTSICDEIEKNLKEKIMVYKAVLDKRLVEINTEAETLKQKKIKILSSEIKNDKTNGNIQEKDEKTRQLEILKHLGKYKPKEFNKFEGLSIQKRWSLKILKNELVPSFFKKMEIRNINIKKILELRKECPKIKIPGIEFFQENHLVVRST